MLAKDVMSDGVLSLAADTTVLEAAVLFVNTRVSAMPVLDDQGVMVGIVTEADLLPYAGLATALDGDAASSTFSREITTRRVADIMTRDVVTVDENATLKDAVVLMAGKRLKRLPVRSGQSIVGIVSRVDLLRVIASHAGQAASDAQAGAVRSDDDHLRRAVVAAVSGKDWSQAERLDVVVIGGSVHLWGDVRNAEVHQAYLEAAQGVPRVASVVSHMHVRKRRG